MDRERHSLTRLNPEESARPPFRAIKRLHWKLRRAIFCLPDTGLFGLTPLRTHILICGYPRAGTTLLQMMMEYALPEARRYGRERSGWRVAAYKWRNDAVIISKLPSDICVLAELQAFYRRRSARLRPIVLLRDPRDVLTSRHATTGDDAYFIDIGEWRQYHDAVARHLADRDVLIIRYEDLVSDLAAIQARIDSFTGEPSQRPFADSHKEGRQDFDTLNLNGVRPVEAGNVARWQRPAHRARLEQILREVPDLARILIDTGYEPDSQWVDRWRSVSSPVAA
jgi:hypothetical protein